jgi:hypothetical protein
MNTLMRSMIAAGGVAAGLALIVGGTPLAHATVISGSSSAFDNSIDLTVTAGPTTTVVTSGPLVAVSGAAPPAYNTPNSLVSGSVLGGLLTGGVINANANSNVTGTGNSGTAMGSVNIGSLSIGPIGTFSGITATALQSIATSSGSYGSLTSTGSTTFTSLVINGTPFLATLTPNDVLFNAGGIEVIGDAQTTTGNGVSSTGITVDGLEVLVTGVTGTIDGITGTINGEILIDQSTSALTAVAGSISSVPEPPAGLPILGIALLGFAAYNYRQKTKMLAL